MAPESYLLVVRDEIIDNFAEFRTHYNLPADTPITGPYDGRLSDDGEQVNLRTALSGTRIVEFEFNDGRGWPIAADDAGHSLVPLVLDAQPDGALDYGGNWRASAYIGGSPGRPDPEPPIAVVINEIMAHTDYTNAAKPEYDSNDWLELYNPTASPVSLQNWYLSDEDANLRKWAIPGTNTIPANGWITFDEITGFHTPITNGFGINKSGEQLFLSYLPGTAEDRVADAVIFRGQENDISLGRWSDGATYWYALTPTTNAANAPPDLHVVITEIVYNPLTTQAFPDDNTNDEYIRIHNPLDTAVALWNEIDAFRIEGAVSYSFPSNTSIPAGGTLTLVSFNPADPSSANLFVEAYGPTNGITILGPYSGKLSNRGERITLEKPQPPDAPGESVSWITIDEVIYFDQSPWPDNTDGTGSALQRISNLVSGNDPSNWKAGPVHIPHILHWKLDDNTGTTALDSSPHANNGTLLDLNAGNADGNTPPVWTDGKYAYALEFDGADDVVRFGGQNVQDYPFTVMAWIKTASGAGTPCAVFVGDGTDAAKYYSIGVSDGKPEIVIRAVARNRYSAVGATDVADNQWHHLAAVFHDQTNRTLYVNAAYETGLPMDFPFLSTVNRVSAGLCDRSTSWDCPWSGRIDDVRIYNRALSTNEIREMMFRPAVGPDNPDEDSDGLPDAWELLYFSATNAPGATPDAHADSDGVCNLDEYIAGTDPTNSASAFAIHITLSNGAVIVTLPTVETAGAGYAGLDRYYDLESSDNLCVGTWLPVPGCSHIRGDDSILSHTNPPAASKFFRATTALE